MGMYHARAGFACVHVHSMAWCRAVSSIYAPIAYSNGNTWADKKKILLTFESAKKIQPTGKKRLTNNSGYERLNHRATGRAGRRKILRSVAHEKNCEQV